MNGSPFRKGSMACSLKVVQSSTTLRKVSSDMVCRSRLMTLLGQKAHLALQALVVSMATRRGLSLSSTLKLTSSCAAVRAKE